MPPSSLLRGVTTIQNYLKTLGDQAGVYRMLNTAGEVLYVGKAKALKKRVVSYTRPEALTNRIQRMIAETVTMEFITTHTEHEALLLESNLIKDLKPRYNVLLKDDKAFPYILIATDHKFPQILKHRGKKTREGHYFGPFAAVQAVYATLDALQKTFLLRPCSDSYFNARTRPCLQYQIKRCSAPCVEKISQADYATLVKQAKNFLEGKGGQLQEELAAKMTEASEAQEYERAALYRDRIKALSHIQAKQDVNIAMLEDVDVVAAHSQASKTCVQVFFFRGGRNYGNKAYYLDHDSETPLAEIVESFLSQFYTEAPCPLVILLNVEVAAKEMLEEAFSQKTGHKVVLETPQRGAKKAVVDHALKNAQEALTRKLVESASTEKNLAAVQKLFGLDKIPERIEVYDNSHIQGQFAVGAMIVAGKDGFIKNAYRKFTIKNGQEAGGERREENLATPATLLPPPAFKGGDDYGMMREVFTRRFSRALKENTVKNRRDVGGEGREDGAATPASLLPPPALPDLVLIDGGAGQLSTVMAVMAELGLAHIPLVGIAKGVDRNAGRERFFLPNKQPYTLPPNDPVLFYLQRLRDEVHRFAITTHRAKRSKAITQNTLDEVTGIGAARKKALLQHFGSAKAVKGAALQDLENVRGISKAIARKIYEHFHA